MQIKPTFMAGVVVYALTSVVPTGAAFAQPQTMSAAQAEQAFEQAAENYRTGQQLVSPPPFSEQQNLLKGIDPEAEAARRYEESIRTEPVIDPLLATPEQQEQLEKLTDLPTPQTDTLSLAPAEEQRATLPQPVSAPLNEEGGMDAGENTFRMRATSTDTPTNMASPAPSQTAHPPETLPPMPNMLPLQNITSSPPVADEGNSSGELLPPPAVATGAPSAPALTIQPVANLDTAPRVNIVAKGALEYTEGESDGHEVPLKDVVVAIDMENKTIKEVVAAIVNKAEAYTGPWYVKWRIKSENEQIMLEKVNLTAETTFDNFMAQLVDHVNNMNGVQLFVRVFSRARVIVISDTY